MALADAWIHRYTDLGESRGQLPNPVLRAVVGVGTPGSAARFAGIIDTGGPITVVAREVLTTGGDPIATGESARLRLGGATNQVPLVELTLEIRPPRERSDNSPVAWRSVVAVLHPWPHQGTAVILGRTGFLDTFTVTFGPSGFAIEPATVFGQRFPGSPQ